MDVQQWMVGWFEENTLATEDELKTGLNDNYFERGWLDSLGFITFLTEMEERFQVEFDNDAFQDRSFSTISGLSKIVEGLL